MLNLAPVMINPFAIGDIKVFSHIVDATDIAEFESGVVHHVYSTFCLTRDAEWSTRLFVLDMKEADEEGIGTFIEVKHLSPAKVGAKVDFFASLDAVNRNEIICSFIAKCGDRIIAEGRTGQKILKVEKLNRIMSAIK